MPFGKINYVPPFFLFNAHVETIFPALLRSVNFTYQQTNKIVTPDDDFLEVSMSTQHSDKVVIISHGLEGNKERPYIKGMAKACFDNGYDVMAWNYRGCGDEMNRRLRFYHSGATDDLGIIVRYAEAFNQYKSIYLIGFSLGGNITLKYAGEGAPPIVKKVVGLSVPLDLKTSCDRISSPSNRIYASRFLKSLKNKVIRKSQVMPGIDINGISKIKTIEEFDDRYTAPLHGFAGALDYYSKCSSLYFLDSIKVPALIVNAKNDPFLSEDCYPEQRLKNHPSIVFESPERGGHVGFAQFSPKGLYWSEQRVLSFLNQ
jgi:predicted alpha/beta-fold hydrolase